MPSEQRTQALQRGGRNQGRPFVLAVCSGKGGVGKSVVAANTAGALALQGHTTLLWDADTHYPNQHILFGVEPPGRVHDVYKGTLSLAAALYHVRDHLQLLAGKTAGGTPDVAPRDIVSTLNEVKTLPFAFVLLDCAAGSPDDVLQFCGLADLTLVVATDEPTSIVDAYGLIKILKHEFPSNAVGMLVNNAIDSDDAEDVVRKLNMATEKFLSLRVPFLGFVPYDRAVRASIVEQRPLVLENPDTEAARALRRFATTMARVAERI